MSQADSSGELTAYVWGVNEDEKFFEYLLEQRSAGPFVFDSIKLEVVLHNVKRRLTTHLSRHVPIDLVRIKFKELRKRFTLFNTILATKGVIYDDDINFVYVPCDQRTKLQQLYPGARQFFHDAPARWNDLKLIFSSNEVGAENTNVGQNQQPLQQTGNNAETPIEISDTFADTSNEPYQRPPPARRMRGRPAPPWRREGRVGQLALRDVPKRIKCERNHSEIVEDRQSHIGPVDASNAGRSRSPMGGPGYPPIGNSNEESTAATRNSWQWSD